MWSVHPTSMTAHDEDRHEDLRDRHAEPERDLAEDMDRDDHRREVEPGVADARRDERVGAPKIRTVRPAGFAGGSGAAGPGATSGAAAASVADRADACVIGGCGSFRTSPEHGFDRRRYRTRSPDVRRPTSEGAQMIPTEPIGSIPRPQALIDGMGAFAAGERSPPRSSARSRTRRSATRSSASRRPGSPVISDGEQTKSSFVTYPLDGLDEPRARRRRDPVRGRPHAAAADASRRDRSGSATLRDELPARRRSATRTCRSSRP